MLSTTAFRPPRDVRNNELFESDTTSTLDHPSNTFPPPLPPQVQKEPVAHESSSTTTTAEGAILPWVNKERSVTTTVETLQEPLQHSKRRKRSSLTFNETVTVVAIPMRTEYSRHVRSKLWSNRLELQQNAARNAIEFASEGWNWRTVVEDELMYVCAFSGALIHPCHCDANLDASSKVEA